MRHGKIDYPDVIDTTSQVVADKYIDDYTKLLLHFDGADAAVATVDSAKNATVSFVGTAQLDTAQSKFGGASLLLDGNSDYISVPDSDNFYFGNADFTVDAWIRWAGSTADHQVIWAQATTSYHMLRVGSNNKLTYSNATSAVSLVDADDMTTGAWHHVAVVRSGNVWTLYKDGVSVASAVVGSACADYTRVFTVGAMDYTGGVVYFFNGWIDELRVSKGIARWTANFTPPTQSYDCPLDTQTKLLIHGGGPNNGVAFYDNSTTARTLTTVGGTKFDSAQYKHRVSSIYFDGAGDYITAPDNDDFAMGTGNFTVECWVRPVAGDGNQYICSQNNAAQDFSSYSFWLQVLDSGGVFYFQGGFAEDSGTLHYCSGGTHAYGAWYHVALIRNGTDLNLYVDGVAVATKTNIPTAAAMHNATDPLAIGRSGSATGTFYFKGHMDEFRVSKGIARWTSDFTPPVAPYDSSLTQYVIDGLDGDTDLEYRLIVYGVSNVADGNISLTINSDTGANYGKQQIYAYSTNFVASRTTTDTALNLGSTGVTTGIVMLSDNIIYAKSGKVRTILTKLSEYISGTTVYGVASIGGVWNNAVNNITNLKLNHAIGNGIGAGSRLILMKKAQLTSGSRFGDIDVVGSTDGQWQLIYDNTLAAAKTNLMLTSQMDSYTKLLIHADGADASTAFYDFSNSAHAISVSGGAQVDTAQKKFGGASALFDGTTDYIYTSDSITDYNFGGGDFTIDFWIMFNALTEDKFFITHYQNGPNYWSILYSYSTTTLYFQAFSASSTIVQVTGSWTPAMDTWYHVALVRNGTTLTFYIDGSSIGSAVDADAVPDYTGSTLYIGAYADGSGCHNGWMDEIRISKGIARWTAAFTPPTRAYNELDGDKDVMYRLVMRSINGANGASISPRFNYDASNYGFQNLYGGNTTVTASRNTSTNYFDFTGYGASTGYFSLVDGLLYAKSGNARVGISNQMYDGTGTTIGYALISGASWNNATDNIKAIQMWASVASGIGAGTHIELWRLNL